MQGLTIVTKLTLILGTLAMVIALLAAGAMAAIMTWQSERAVREKIVTETHNIITNELITTDGQIRLQKDDNGLQLSQTLRENNLSLLLTSKELRPIARYGIYRNFTAEELEVFINSVLTDPLEVTGIYRDVLSKQHGLFDTFTVPLYTGESLLGYLQVARVNDVLPMIYASFGDALVILTPILWVVSIAVAGWSSRLVLSPLTTLVKYMEHVEVDAKPRTIAITHKLGPELTTLVVTFNQLLAKVAETISRERELTENISHEIKTPLTRLSTTLQAIVGQVPVSIKPKIAELTRESLQMGRTVETILSIARAKLAPTGKAWKLTTLIAELGRELEITDRLITKIPQKEVLTISREHLRILLRNLLDNGAKHGEENGKIEIKAQTVERNWKIEVTNHVGKKSRVSGHGLGLSIARQICRNEGWTIKAVKKEDLFIATVSGEVKSSV